jgi:hypothetical protein
LTNALILISKIDYQKKESGPLDLTTDDGKKFKEAVDLNKKVMGQFIQAFSTINLLNNVNLQKKADKQFPSGKG